MRTDASPAPASNINAPTPTKGEVNPPLLGSAIFLSTESWSMRFRAWLTEEGRDVELALV